MHLILKLLLVTLVIFTSLTLVKDAQAESLEVKGVKLHYIVEGKGEPVVLIHGLHASTKTNWGLPGVINLLSKNYQVISLDLPGHGESDKPENQDAYGLQMVEDVNQLLDHLKVKKAHIVGYSMGGMIAMKFMAKHPEHVLSGVVAGMGWLPEGSFLQRTWARLPSRGSTPEACPHSLGQLALTETELKGIQVPVVVIVGDRDPVKRLYVTPLTQVRKDWQVVEISDAGHLNCVTKPQFKAEIKKWLDNQK